MALCSFTLYRPASQKSITGDWWRLEECNSVIFCLIFKSKTPSKRSVLNLNVETLFLKIGPEIALRQPFKVGHCIKIAIDLHQETSWLWCIAQLRTAAVKQFLVRFSKTTYLSLDYEQTFLMLFYFWRISEKWPSYTLLLNVIDHRWSIFDRPDGKGLMNWRIFRCNFRRMRK